MTTPHASPVPIAGAYAGRRGFDRSPIPRLVVSLRRYQAMRDDPATDAAGVAYAKSVIVEIRREIERRNTGPVAA